MPRKPKVQKNDRNLERLVEKIATTSGDAARARVEDQLCGKIDADKLQLVDALFRKTKARLANYPAVLGKLFGQGWKEAGAILKELITSGDEVTSANAIDVAISLEMGGVFEDVLLPLAKKGRMDCRRDAAIFALAKLRTRAAVSVLCELAEDVKLDAAHREVVFGGLAESDEPRAQQLIEAAFENLAESPVVRCSAAYGVARKGDARGLAALWSNLALVDEGELTQVLVHSLGGLERLIRREGVWSSAPIMTGAAKARRDLKRWNDVNQAYRRAKRRL